MNIEYQSGGLANDIRAGSENAFKYLFDSFHLKIYTVSKRMGLPEDMAGDIVQETFLQLWNQRANINDDLSIGGLIYTIAKRIVLKKIAAKKNTLYPDNAEHLNILHTTDAFDQISLNETNKYILQEIKLLPKNQEQIFSLNAMEGLSPAEIAEKLGLSKRTVENQIFRARKRLREKLVKSGLLILVILFSIFFE